MKKLNKILAVFLSIVTLACSINITDVLAASSTETLKFGDVKVIDGVKFDVGSEMYTKYDGKVYADYTGSCNFDSYDVKITNTSDKAKAITVKYPSINEYNEFKLLEEKFTLSPNSTESLSMNNYVSEVVCAVEDVVKEQKKTTKVQETKVKQGKIDGVVYCAKLEYNAHQTPVCMYNMISFCLRNTRKMPVKLDGKVVFYGKNNKKVKTETFEEYLYAGQRKLSDSDFVIDSNVTVTNYKITYKVTKVSSKTIYEILRDTWFGYDDNYWTRGRWTKAEYKTSLYNIKLRNGHNDLGVKHYSDQKDKKQAYIKDFDYDKSTGTFTFTVHYTKKITYDAHNFSRGAPSDNINILMNLYDKDGYLIGFKDFSTSLVGETFVKGDTATITGTIDANELYGVDSIDDVATIDFCFINASYK